MTDVAQVTINQEIMMSMQQMSKININLFKYLLFNEVSGLFHCRYARFSISFLFVVNQETNEKHFSL